MDNNLTDFKGNYMYFIFNIDQTRPAAFSFKPNHFLAAISNQLAKRIEIMAILSFVEKIHSRAVLSHGLLLINDDNGFWKICEMFW